MKKALIIVDVQNDFCKGGALAVPNGEKTVPYINKLIEQLKTFNHVVVYTADWHPTDHSSFQDNGGTWPSHCVENTPGAQFHPELNVKGAVFRKGFDKTKDSYSGFGGRDLCGGSLRSYLVEKQVSEVVVVGLALDYCVKATALDAKEFGFKVSVDVLGTEAVNLKPEDGTNALDELKSAGVEIKVA